MRRSAVLLGALILGGCNTAGQPTAMVETRGPAVAFESIDGPPEGLFRRMVSDLDTEAQARQVSVVSRESPAQFRVRSYVSTYVEGKKSAVAWVWDVYDANERRAQRLSGEEVLPANGGDPWGAVTDEVLHRMSRNGMAQLTAYLGRGTTGSTVAQSNSATPAGNADLAFAADRD